jgi:hypothetical protein
MRWAWDDYIGAALAPFPTEDGARAHAILERHLAGRWTEETLGSAPPAVQALAESFGGVLTGQELFAAGADGSPVLFACWWPWGSGERISVRIGLWRPAASEADTAAMHATLRSWFRV